MKSIEFISTPIHPKKYDNFIEDVFDEDIGWQKRARKLRERRWRKLANKIAATERHRHFHRPSF